MTDSSIKKDIATRILNEDDLCFAMEVKELAGWNQVKTDWLSYLSFEPNGCFLVEVDGENAGTATTVSYENKFAWIGMVLVHPQMRRLGLGTLLLERAIDYLREIGIDSIKLDATPMGKKVYIPMGFVDEYDLNRYEGTVNSNFNIDLDDSAIIPIDEENIEKVIAFDKEYFGADRGFVLKSIHERSKGLSFFLKENEKIVGYIMARKGSDAYQIGPWVSNGGKEAEQLLKNTFKRLQGKRIFLDVPCPNLEGCQLLEKYSFTIQRGFSRMYLGHNNHPGIPEGIFATSGAEKG